jgi:tetratricopeptide (TPR) repeat protein
MTRPLGFTLVLLALVALASTGLRAQSGATRKPPDPTPASPETAAATQTPVEAPAELPAEARAFNAAMAEKNPLKRVELLEKFVADNPKATTALVDMAKSQVSSSLLTALKEARTKYQAVIDADLEYAKKYTDTRPLYATYIGIASRLFNAGVYSEEAEDFARKGLAAMDERTYTDMRKKQYERSLAAYERNLAAYEEAVAAAKDSRPAAPTEAPAAAPAPSPGGAPAAPAGPSYRFASKDGVMQASIAPPRPARSAPPTPPPAPRPPTKPTMPTDEEMRNGLRTERASAQATFGQVLLKRGKTDEGLKVLKEAYAAKPAPSTVAGIARSLNEAAKKAGSDNDQLEYLAVLALSGRATADEFKEFDAVYRKTHNGSADGMEAMLDARWRRDHARFAVTPFARAVAAKPTGRTVLAEVFPGSG